MAFGGDSLAAGHLKKPPQLPSFMQQAPIHILRIFRVFKNIVSRKINFNLELAKTIFYSLFSKETFVFHSNDNNQRCAYTYSED